MVVHLLSPNGRYDMTYLRNYAVLNVKDRLARVDGVGDVQLFGSGDYSMRVWLDPQKVAQRGLSAERRGRRHPRAERAGRRRRVGASPGLQGIDVQLSINAQGRLQNEEEFGDIIVKTGADGAVTRLRDIARIELGAADYSLRSLLDNKDAVAVPIFAAPGSNAIAISNGVRATMADIKKAMPEGVDYEIVYDPTQFVRASIESVVHTLLEAIALVVLVVILFLQTWRASIIPLLAVPVVGGRHLRGDDLFGFSINALSLFGLVLAIGIVVDDAIVVVENVERNIEAGLTPARGHLPRDARGLGPDHRDRAGADRGVRAARLHQRADRPVLPAVRADDRDLDGDLGDQLADAVAGAGRAAAEGPRRAEGRADARHGPRASAASSAGFNRVFQRGSDAYSGGVKTRDLAQGA